MSGSQKNDASTGSEPFVPCYNKKNWKEDSWCQEDCIQRVLENPETCDWHCVDPDMARQTSTNSGWACMSSGKYSRCTNSCSCRGSPGDSTWCCGAESTDVCWDNKCYPSCAITLPPSEPSSRPTSRPTTKQPTKYPTKYPTPYPTHFPSRSPTLYPTTPTFHTTHPRSHNYVLLRRNSACVGDEKNLGLTTIDQCGDGCQNITKLFIFGKVGSSKCTVDEVFPTCICRCELGEKTDALDCKKAVKNNNFDLYRVLDGPLPTFIPTFIPSTIPSWEPSAQPSEMPSLSPSSAAIKPVPTSVPSPFPVAAPSFNPTHMSPYKPKCEPIDCPTITCPKPPDTPCCMILYILASLCGAGAIAYSCWFGGKRWCRRRRYSTHAQTRSAIAMVNFRHAMENIDLPPNDSMNVGIDISGN